MTETNSQAPKQQTATKDQIEPTWIQVENAAKPGVSDGEKKESEHDDYLVEDDVIYDEADWQETVAKADGSNEDATNQNMTFIGRSIHTMQTAVAFLWTTVNGYTRGRFSTIVFLVGFLAYFIGAMVHEQLGTDESVKLLVCTILAIVIKTRTHWMKGLGMMRGIIQTKDGSRLDMARRATRWTLYLLLLSFMVWILVDQGMRDTRNLRGVPGLFIMMLVCLCFSSAPSHINWHTIYWSFGMQFICALFVVRLDFGKDVMEFIQDRFNEYFANTHPASIAIFGQTYRDHYLVFGALPILFLSNATISLLYYFGAIQLVIKAIGSFLQFVLDTTPVESTGVAAGIFLEGTMALLGLRHYLGRMSKSQLFLIVTSVFSSLGGAYVGILISLNVHVSDIIPAMLMSAPATFTVCKLMVPEVKKIRKCKIDDSVNDEKQKNKNVLEVIQSGAITILPLTANIVAIIFVFYSFISWVNHTFVWFGERVGVDNFTMEFMFSYLMYPISWCMGVDNDDIRQVGTLLGYRICSTNLVAFTEMNKMTSNRAMFYEYMSQTNGTGKVTYERDDVIIGNTTLHLGYISERSERIVTYSLCGFSSIVSVGVNLGIITSLIPRRRAWLSRIFLGALVAGNLSNCMTGAFAGIFYYK